MSVRRSHTVYAAVRTEGGLLPPDLIDRIQVLDDALGGLTPGEYRLPEKSRIDTEIAQAWQATQTHFASFQRTRELVNREKVAGTSETRTWVQQVLRELGYRELRFVAQAETIGERSFLVSHRAGDAENAPPVHIISFLQDLDARAARTGGREQRSPQALVQGYLNASHHQWGLVTNGLVFRLLRENRQIDRALRVEFDLESMLESENFAEFRLFWLILHRSRFVQPGERHETAWLEQWSQTASKEGARAMEALRPGVEKAIQELGQGLLAHPENQYLNQKLRSGELTVDAYYSQLLRLVYRLLFLLVAEERQLLFTTDADERAVARYQKHYSIDRLREEASRRRNWEAHQDDLWRSLLVTFDAMRHQKEATALGIQPLGGGLFGAGSCPDAADDAAPGTTGSDRITGRPMLSNAHLLNAIEALSEVTRDSITRRINYRDLDVEELGSVYEGLLERRPALEAVGEKYRFAFGDSTSRKETGSYYTPSSLVQELLNSALDPVIDQAVANMATPQDARKALLALNVIDPACGSGHFLLGAARRIGRRLAEIGAGEGNEPEIADVRHGVREAIRHCIYGVDKNPLAIDLCKTALWIESHEPGAPVSFLDHHIKRGDSLVGVFDLDVLQSGIPDGAYTAVTGDDKKIASDLKARNRKERPKGIETMAGQRTTARASMLWEDNELENLVASLAKRLEEIDAMPGGTIAEVQQKEAAYYQLHGRDDWRDVTTACDLWTYAFFAPLNAEGLRHVPTSATVRRMIGKGDVPGDIVGSARATADDVGFFHWPLQFPEVFQFGGFDTVLGNPPWEQVQPEEVKFFATRAPDIAEMAGAKRKAKIKKLVTENPPLAEAWDDFVQLVERSGKSMRESGRFPLTARGKLNLYSLFAEHVRNLIAPSGHGGVIVPTGIATDDSNKFYFADLVNNASLAALYDFENRRALFEGVHRSYKFSLVVLAGRARQDNRFRAGFFLLDPLEIHDPEKTFLLSAEDIALFNPNTKTVPIFRSSRDAELTKAIYQAAPVLVNENDPLNGNPWGVSFRQGLFNMTSASHLFRTREELEEDGATLGTDGRFRKSGHEWLPLYEAKLMHHFDHRFATYTRDGNTREVTLIEHSNSDFVVIPRYWVSSAEVGKILPDSRKWLSGFRGITNATNERTAIFGIVPYVGAGNSLPITDYLKSPTQLHEVALISSATSVVFDFVARQKVGGSNFNFFIVKQLPVLPPETYTEDLLNEIVPRVLELTYTAHDMTPFARDLGYEGEPFIWDEERRAQLRADLDGIYAHLYGISRDGFDYILETFPIVKRKDIAEFGEYRTKRLCLEAFDRYAHHPAVVAAKPEATVPTQ